MPSIILLSHLPDPSQFPQSVPPPDRLEQEQLHPSMNRHTGLKTLLFVIHRV